MTTSIPRLVPFPILLRFWGGWLLLGLFLGACSSGPPGPEVETAATGPAAVGDLSETPPPAGSWRPHRLSFCSPDSALPPAVERYLALCSEYFRDGSGSDGMIEMEFGLEAGYRQPLMLLTLAQLYLMAGQGDPDLLPVEGPAADVGDWDRNRVRLLQRAEELLLEAAPGRPDDAAVDYLLADVARAQGDQAEAAVMVASGMGKCTGGRSFAILWQYQQLNNYPPRYLGGPPPKFPQDAVAQGLSGDVVLDVLLNPAGEVRQVVVVESPAATLSRAAEASVRQGGFEAGRVGKYPIWSWLRVTTAFHLDS